MSTLLERPVAVESGGAPARRAVARWAWRLFRREWRQQLLVLALLMVAVGATVLGSAVGTNTPPPPNAGFGTADHLVVLPGSAPRLAADLDALRQRFGTVDVIENQRIETGLVQGAELRAQDPRGSFGYPTIALLSGRYPVGPDEAAMTPDLARTLGLRVGARWTGARRTRRIVGLVENPQNLLDNFALVVPGQVSAPDQVTVLFDQGPADLGALPENAAAQAPQPPAGLPPAIVVFVLAVFGLVFVGLVAVAGFSVLAQRRQRALGMFAAIGATDRQVRMVLLANGAVVGVVASLAGALLGFAAWLAYAPRLQASSHHRISWTSLPYWLIATTMVLAVVTSVLAAGRPARTAARLSVMAALSGRPVPPKPAHRSALPGLALLGLGTLLLFFCGGWGSETTRESVFQLGGLLCDALGLLLLAPAGITLLGRIAPRTPLTVRLALRDLARYRARSGAALAAVSFAVLIAVLISLIATGRYANSLDYVGPNLPSNELMVYPPGAGPDGGGKQPGAPTPAGGSVQPVAQAVGSGDVLALESAEVSLGWTVHDGVLSSPGVVYVATPELLHRYGIDPASIDPDAILLTSRPGLAGRSGTELVYGDPAKTGCCLTNPRIQHLAGLPLGTSEPNLVLTEHGVATLGVTVSPAGALIRTPRALSAAQINAARQAAAATGLTIETKSQAPSLNQLRDYATVAGILLALGVLAVTVGLIRGEAARDLRTLTATGAGRRIRRGITSATAGALGLVGAVFGTAVGYLVTVAFFRSQLSQAVGQVPVLDLVLILVGLPLVAAVASWLLAGREPVGVSREPIE